jgi:hypothetical protein
VLVVLDGVCFCSSLPLPFPFCLAYPALLL